MAGGTQGLSRSLDKTLEDAQLSGILSLHSRNLRQFPTSAAKYDLSDTISCDITRNRLVELPVEICEYGSLESLYAYHNIIKFIPTSVQYLSSLVYLDLSRNQLESIPSVLCKLPLQVLLLGRNRLKGLPSEISSLAPTLMELDVSCNLIRSLPSEMGCLKKLRVMNARQNLLNELPFDFVCGLKLLELDVSCNQLTSLPVTLRQMTSLIVLNLDNNPLVSPPIKECMRGCVHTFKWLEMEDTKKEKRAKGVPVDLEWPPYRGASLSRKNRNVMVQSSDKSDLKLGGGVVGRVERRSRTGRYNTIGADSGYASSTLEDNRSSTELNGISDNIRRSPVGEEAPSNSPSATHPPLSLTKSPPVAVPYTKSTADSANVKTSNYSSIPPASTLNSQGLNSNGFRSPTKQSPDSKKGGSSTTSSLGVNYSPSGSRLDTKVCTNLVDEVLTACAKIGSDRRTQEDQLTSWVTERNRTERITNGHSSSTEEGSPTPKATPIRPDDARKMFQYGSGSSINSERSHQQLRLSPGLTNGHLPNGHLTPNKPHPPSPSESLGLKPKTPETLPSPSSEFAMLKPTPPRMKSLDICSMYSGGGATVGGRDKLLKTPSEDFKEQPISEEKEDSPPTHAPPPIPTSEKPSITSTSTSMTTSSTSVTTNERTVKGKTAEKKEQSGTFKKPLAPTGGGTMKRSTSGGVGKDKNQSRGLLTTAKRNDSLSSSQSSLSSTASGSLRLETFTPLLESAMKSNRSKPGSETRKGSASSSTNSAGKTRVSTTGNTMSTSSTASTSSSVSSTNRLKTASGTASASSGKSAGTNSGSGTNSSGTTASGRPNKAPPAPPVQVFKSSGKFESSRRPRDSLMTSHSSSLRKQMDPKQQLELIDQMRRVIESRLELQLPEDNVELSVLLSDGVMLCNLLNAIRVRAVSTIHTTSPTMPTLSSAKCRRNVENFLMACRRLGVPESKICAQADVLDKKNLATIGKNVIALTKISSNSPKNSNSSSKLASLSSGKSNSPPSTSMTTSRTNPKISAV